MNQCNKCKAAMNERWVSCFVCGCPIEKTQDASIEIAFPLSFVMDSAVVGQVRVEVFEDGGAIVDGVTYSNKEIKDFLSRGLGGDDLKRIHEVKRKFKGILVPQVDLSQSE